MSESLYTLGTELLSLARAIEQTPESDEATMATHCDRRDAILKKLREADATQFDWSKLIAAYYRSEIGRCMQQAEHWVKNGAPLAVHHRVNAADTYFQIVALFERHEQWNENPFDKMRWHLEREPGDKPYGAYPPTPEIHRYRDPAFVVAELARLAQMTAHEDRKAADIDAPTRIRELEKAIDGVIRQVEDADSGIGSSPAWHETWNDLKAVRRGELATKPESLVAGRGTGATPASAEPGPQNIFKDAGL